MHGSAEFGSVSFAAHVVGSLGSTLAYGEWEKEAEQASDKLEMEPHRSGAGQGGEMSNGGVQDRPDVESNLAEAGR